MTEPTRNLAPSDALKQFLQDWLGWAVRGDADCDLFKHNIGLCYTAQLVDWKIRASAFNAQSNLAWELKELLAADFPTAPVYPFHNGSRKAYDHELATRSVTFNPKRLAWVRSKLGLESPAAPSL